MVVIAKKILNRFGEIHADSIDPLNEWWRICKRKNWKSLSDVKKDFGSVDYVGNDRYVFNIKGNKYRLVVMIFFDVRTIFIRFIGTHSEYNKIDCRSI
jgi:mRNA interferase HigB